MVMSCQGDNALFLSGDILGNKRQSSQEWENKTKAWGTEGQLQTLNTCLFNYLKQQCKTWHLLAPVEMRWWVWRAWAKSYQWAGVGGVRGVFLEITGQAEVRHLAHKVAVDQDVAGGQVSVDVIHLRQVLHASGNSPQHSHQLDHCELPIILLPQKTEISHDVLQYVKPQSKGLLVFSCKHIFGYTVSG